MVLELFDNPQGEKYPCPHVVEHISFRIPDDVSTNLL